MQRSRGWLARRGLVAALAAFALLAHPGSGLGSGHVPQVRRNLSARVRIITAAARASALPSASARRSRSVRPSPPRRPPPSPAAPSTPRMARRRAALLNSQSPSSQTSNASQQPSGPPPARFTVARGETRFVPNEVLVEVTSGDDAGRDRRHRAAGEAGAAVGRHLRSRRPNHLSLPHSRRRHGARDADPAVARAKSRVGTAQLPLHHAADDLQARRGGRQRH